MSVTTHDNNKNGSDKNDHNKSPRYNTPNDNNNGEERESDVDLATLRKVIAACAIGNFVEWFDFAIYGFLAVIIAEHFFPPGDPALALLQTFAVFAVAFALRPLGGIFFGMLGDRIGRKRVLSMTVLLMAGATTLIGVLPTYQSVGLLAPFALALARCVQGFSAGGEYAGACAFVMEHAPRTRKARYASFVPVSTFMAFATAAALAYMVSSVLSEAALASWGWRIPFLIAAPLGLVGLYMRLNLDESPAFQALKQRDAVPHSPLGETLRSQSATIVYLGAFISATALSFYMFTTYFTTYMQVVGGASQTTALLASLGALVFAAALCPLAGRYADRVGRRRTILTAGACLIIAVFPAYTLAGSGEWLPSLLGAGLMAVGAVVCNVVTAVLLSEQFPTRVRYTSSALCYNVAYTLFGGTAPLVATWLISASGHDLAPALYLIAITLLAMWGGLRLPETAGRALDADEKEWKRSATGVARPAVI